MYVQDGQLLEVDMKFKVARSNCLWITRNAGDSYEEMESFM